MRLNKYISHNSKYSRREADKLIADGDVSINKKVVSNFAIEVSEDDIVAIKNHPIKETTEYTVVVYNKPKGVLVTKKDDRGRATIYHKLGGKLRHFIPVGRLDYASEGLLLLSDSPLIVQFFMESDMVRTYNVKIDKPFSPEMEEAMKNGLTLADASAGGHEKSKIVSMEFAPFVEYEVRGQSGGNTKIRVSINEGKNRELRRFFAHFGAKVLDLKRIAYGNITLNNLPENKSRFFTKKEYTELREMMKKSQKVESKPKIQTKKFK
jgi:23S rRNA pseudouridine2605 synthase